MDTYMISTSDYRTTTRPPVLQCEVCQANAATYRKWDGRQNVNVCKTCKEGAK